MPLELHPTCTKMDSSKLTTYMECPRKFFYENILGWRSNSMRNDLKYGEAIHLGMAHIRQTNYADVSGAFELFLHCYRQQFDADTDCMFEYKNPQKAQEVFEQYVEKYAEHDSEEEIIFIERPGIVAIDETRELYYTMDLVVRHPVYGILWRDYKTKKFGPSDKWRTAKRTAIQTGTYTHGLYSTYPPEEVYGGEIEGIYHYKTKPVEFERIPLQIQMDAMNAWWDSVLWHMDRLWEDFDLLSEATEDTTTMNCFLMRPTACESYFGCPYIDLCAAWSNPLRRCYEPPPRFSQCWWNPETKKEETARENDERNT